MKETTMKFIIARLCENQYRLCDRVGLRASDKEASDKFVIDMCNMGGKVPIQPTTAEDVVCAVQQHFEATITSADALDVLAYAAKVQGEIRDKESAKDKQEFDAWLAMEKRKDRQVTQS